MGKNLFLILLATLFSFGFPACNKTSSESANQTPASGKSGVDNRLPVRVFVAIPTRLDNSINVSGTILANEEVELHSEVSGKIQKLLIREGAVVKKGDLLFKINDADLQAQLKKTELRVQLAKDKEQRQKTLLQKDGISQEAYDIALNDLNSAIADVQLLKANIEKTELRAPFDGKIGLRYISEGSYISPNTKIALLQDFSSVKIDFTIPEKYVEFVQQGTKIEFSSASSNKTFPATVYAIEPKIDPLTRTVQIRAHCPNPLKIHVPGSFAKIFVILNSIENTFMIPTESIIPELKGQKVFLVKNGKIQPQSVSTGIRNDQKVQITAGLNIGDSIITTGMMQARPGLDVRIVDIP